MRRLPSRRSARRGETRRVGNAASCCWTRPWCWRGSGGRELADSVAQHLAAAEDILPLWSLRVILVLRELAARGDAAPGYRESAEDTTRDRLADPKVRMWLSRLAPSWSELQTFLAGHGIVAEPEARALRDAEDSASSSERA
jgi:hypothetical protein